MFHLKFVYLGEFINEENRDLIWSKTIKFQQLYDSPCASMHYFRLYYVNVN